MKIVKILIGLIVVAVVGVFVLLFTPIGNSVLKPVVENKIKEAIKTDVKLNTFALSFGSIDLDLDITPKNNLHIKGDFSIASNSFNIDYNVKFLALKELRKLAKQPLNGEFKTNGNIKGNPDFIVLSGKSDVAQSDTTYEVKITKLNPSSIVAKIKDLKVEDLLYIIGQKKYAKADLDLDVNFKDIRKHKLDGVIKLLTKNGSFDRSVLKKDFNITIPKTRFAMNLDAALKGDNVNYTYLFNSNLAKIKSGGNVVIEPLKTDLTYSASIKELALLKPLTKADLRGKVNLKGIVKGNKEKMLVTLDSDIASSDTKVKATLKEFKPSLVLANIKHLKLQKLLYMIKQPHYTDGTFDLKAKLTSLEKENLKGDINTYTKGRLDSRYLTKAYEFKHMMPKTDFKLKTHTKLDKTLIDTKVDLVSNLIKLNVKKARFDLKDSSLKSDYTTVIPSLDKLYFVSDKHLRGSIKATGNIKKDKDLLFLAHSNIARGKLDVKLLNDDLHLDLKGMQTLKVLHILIYPEVFSALMDAKVDYNLKSSKGIATAKLKNGLFTRNQAFDLMKQYAKIDLYKDKYNGDVKADINKELIKADVDLRSLHATIKTKHTVLNTKTNYVDSKVVLDYKHTPVTVMIKGDINHPKVNADLKDFMKSKVGKKLENKANKEINKLFKKLF